MVASPGLLQQHREFGVFWLNHQNGRWGEYRSAEGYPWIHPGIGDHGHTRYKTKEEALKRIADIKRIHASDGRLRDLELVVGYVNIELVFERVKDAELQKINFEEVKKKLTPSEFEAIRSYIIHEQDNAPR